MTEIEYAGKFLLPRLPASAARKQLALNRKLTLPELAECQETLHPAAAPAPVGGHPASARHLASIQTAVRALAGEYSFPSPLSARGQAAFDRECATLLFREMDIVTGDAASHEAWSFVSLVLVPEIPFWRFPGGAEERYLGSQRNTFQRLWWRAWTLGPDLTAVPTGAMPFGEDDFVQLMERPTVSGNRRVARHFYDVVIASDLNELDLTRSELVRRLVVQVRARRSHVAFDALDDAELRAYLLELRDSM